MAGFSRPSTSLPFQRDRMARSRKSATKKRRKGTAARTQKRGVAKRRVVRKASSKGKAAAPKISASQRSKRSTVRPKTAKTRASTAKAGRQKIHAPAVTSVSSSDREKAPYYITTAISYPNGPPHIGHAYEAIATDAIARFMRLDGYDVYFLTGTDEHGQKMQQTAAREGLTARQLRDRNVPRFEAMVERLNCSNNDFIHTTEERHHRASIAIWEEMEAAGDIYLDKYAGWYSVRDEAYYAEGETHVSEQKQRIATKTGTPVEWVEEESYFFRLSAYQQKLLALYERVPDFVLPRERLNEVASFVRGGLQDLSISRTTFDWGVKVPGNAEHIMHLWVEA
jgi:hypothetical protein